MIRGRGVAKNIIDFAIFSGLGGTGCLSEVAAVMVRVTSAGRGPIIPLYSATDSANQFLSNPFPVVKAIILSILQKEMSDGGDTREKKIFCWEKCV